MKQTILTLAIAAVFAACNSKPAEQTTTTTQKEIVTPDTAGYAQFQDWKQRQDIMNNQGTTEETQSFDAEGVDEAVEESPKVVYQNAPARQERVVRVSKPAPRVTENVRTERSVAKAPKSSGTRQSRSRDDVSQNESTAGTSTTAGNGTSVGTGEGVGSLPTEAEQPAAKKEGWSKAAKGTAIGAGSGAVLGAIISKDKGKGAAIGGIIGAAGGYVLGRKQDKKDGRY